MKDADNQAITPFQAQAHAQWQHLLAEGLSRGALVRFHSRYKYLVMACSPKAYRELGRLLGSMSGDDDPQRVGANYFIQLQQALQHTPSRGTHTNVLQHLSGYLRPVLAQHERSQLQETIRHYQQGSVTLTIPLALLRHYLQEHPDPYLLQQVYLQPALHSPAAA